MASKRVPSWRPRELMIVNVRGRAILCDHFVCAEWRRDPWPGFDLSEGWWDRVGGTPYERHTQEHPHGRGCGCPRQEAPFGPIRSAIRELLARNPVPAEAATEDRLVAVASTPDNDIAYRIFTLRNRERMLVDPYYLDALLTVIDGEPAEWRAESVERPLHAVDERGRWLGMVMPVRVEGKFIVREMS